jgi:hypothetical protein
MGDTNARVRARLAQIQERKRQTNQERSDLHRMMGIGAPPGPANNNGDPFGRRTSKRRKKAATKKYANCCT